MAEQPRGRGRGRGRGQPPPEIGGTSLVEPMKQMGLNGGLNVHAAGDNPIASNGSGNKVTNGVANPVVDNGIVKPAAPPGTGPNRGGTTTQKRPPRHVYIEEDVLQGQFPKERFGKQGQVMQVQTNYIGFRSLPINMKIVMYDTNFSMQVMAKTVVDRYHLLKTAQSKGLLPNCAIAYDGRIVFSSEQLGDTEQVLMKVSDDKYTSGPEASVSFRKICEISPGSEQWYRVVNIIFNLCQQLLGQKKYGDDFFIEPSRDVQGIKFDNPDEETFIPRRYKLKDSFEMLQGYGVSLHRCQNGNQIVPIMHVGGIHRLANLNTAMDELNRGGTRAAASMPGRTVLTRHNNRSYIIVDVIQKASIDDTFESGGNPVSFRAYFAQRYGIQLTAQQQPFLKLKLRRVDRIKRMRRQREIGGEADKEVPQDIHIPSELCYLTGFSEQEKATFQRDREFNHLCRKMPNQRAADVSRFCQFVGSKDETRSLMKDWKLELMTQPLNVQGRVLDSCYKSNQRFRQSAALNARSIKVARPAHRENNSISIAVIQGGPRIQLNVIQGYISSLQKEAEAMGFAILWPSQRVISSNSSLSDKLMEAKEQQVDLALIGLDDQVKYKEIKTTSIQHGLLTQVVRGPTMQKAQTAQKVALQIACKVGYTPWTLSGGLPTNGNMDFMIVGIDTFVGKGASAVQASVFSLDQDCSQYFTFVNYLQGRNMEYHANLDHAFKEALQAYRRRNNKLPGRILVYRDGVSDSQLFNVKDSEVKCLEELLASEYGSTPYHILFTVVKKRISQRFFIRDSKGEATNVKPGTVIDSTVVKPKWFEYFIVPQEAGQGTATPSSFNVIHNNRPQAGDSLYMSPDDMQRATFALTHLYFNWAGTIRVPAPVQYAHKCAFLLGQCAINSAIHRNIRENLFYL